MRDNYCPVHCKQNEIPDRNCNAMEYSLYRWPWRRAGEQANYSRVAEVGHNSRVRETIGNTQAGYPPLRGAGV